LGFDLNLIEMALTNSCLRSSIEYPNFREAIA
jgi:hypothetical protein